MKTEKTATTPKCITLNTLIKRGVEIKNRKLSQKLLYIESLDANIRIEELPHEVYLEVLNSGDNADDDAMLVYESVVEPSLKDKDLQAAYDCDSPDEIVRKLFKPGEVAALSKEVVRLAGYGNNSVREVIEDLKNS